MKSLAPILLLTFLFLPLHADEQSRQVQSALKDAGFYYGAVDGRGGDETTAALRRYQIRNGLNVTGTATAETLSSLKIQGAASDPLPEKIIPTRPSSESAPPPTQRPQTGRPQLPPQTPSPDTFLGPNEASRPVAPAPLVAKPDSPALGQFFAGTEHALVSREEQSLRLAKAQSQLRQLRYYSGIPDGLPGPNTEEALLKFQRSRNLPLTGKLDSGTTQALNGPSTGNRRRIIRKVNPQAPPSSLPGVWVH